MQSSKNRHLGLSALALIIVTISTMRAAQAQTTGPAPTPTPLFTYSGDVRAFYFGRTNGNSCLTCKPKGSPNATAFNFGGSLHGQINIPHTPWALGATYMGAYPFGANAPGPLNNIGYNPQIDNTVPGYPLSVFGEEYLQYKNAGTFGQIGKEMLTATQSPWANSADTRILPATYQGTQISTSPTADLTIEAMYIARWKSRVTSAFNSNTLLTSCNTAYPTDKGPVQGASGTFTVPGDLCSMQRTTHGFGLASASYVFGASGLALSAYQYQIYDLVDMTWLSGQYNFAKRSFANPFVAGQFLAENNDGQSYLGVVHNHTVGGLIGTNVANNLTFTAGYDNAPATRYVVPTAQCKGTLSSPVGPKLDAIFGGLPDPSESAPKGFVVCYGGGVASPYTDGYTSDPLYTTSLTQGMSEVTKPGTAAKTTLTWFADNHRLRLLASDAWYSYSLPGSIKNIGNGDGRMEFDLDAWFFLNAVHPGQPYKGLSIRQRYGDRTFSFAPFEFKSSRTQLEYDF
jgi:outer membrane porin, OprD family